MRPSPVESTRPVHGGLSDAEARALGLDPAQVIDFSASVNPFGPPPAVLAAVAAADYSRYPDPAAAPLRDALSAGLGVPPECVLPGNGSSELIWLAARAFLSPGDAAVVLGPTFGEYEAACRAAGAEVVELRAAESSGFEPDLKGLRKVLSSGGVNAVFVCNPNNPTGTLIDPDQLRRLAVRHPETVFVADEAFVPFVPGRPGSSYVAGRTLPNVLWLCSMTKVYGMPGLRLGYALGQPALLETLRALQPPWSVGTAAQAAGLAALDQVEWLDRSLQAVEAARGALVLGLQALGLAVHPGAANFVLVRTGDGRAAREALLQRGCCVRDCASFGLPEWVRIGVRRPAEIERLLNAWGEVLGRPLSPPASRRQRRAAGTVAANEPARGKLVEP